jgi:polysaccharide chain length determinant protein (PEP-CTERM system associated)
MNDSLRAPRRGDETDTGVIIERVRSAWTRRKWLAILVFALPATVSVSLVMALPDVYVSTVTVLVERQQVPEAFVRPTVTSEVETRLHTISQEILSRSRLEALARRFGLYADPQKGLSGQEVIERMRRDIRLDLKETQSRWRGGTTTAFALSYRGRDPHTVALVANALASFYVEENLKARERQATGTAEFMKVQLDDTKRRLDEQERIVSAFRSRHIGELPQQMPANLAALETLTTQLRLNSDNQLRAAERREALSTQLAEAATLARLVPQAVSPAPGAEQPPAMRLARLRQELTTARSRWTDAHPTVSRLREEIRALEPEVAAAAQPDAAAAQPAPPSPYTLRLKEALQAAEAEIKILKTEERRLRDAIVSYQARVENTPRREQEFQAISRDYESTRELYQSLLKRHGEAQLAESMEQRQKGEQFRVIDPAIPGETPAAPNRLRFLLVGLALSAGLAVAAVMAAETLDTSFHSAGDLRAFTTAPVLASIGRIVTTADARRRRWRFRLAALSAVVVLAIVAGGSYFVAHGNERLVQILARERA